MTEYTPSNWVVIKITGDDPHYRVLGGWMGGYLYGDSWRINSGIVRVDDSGEDWFFYGSSGSVYRCSKDRYGLKMSNAPVFASLQRMHGGKVSLMPVDTNWLEMDWIIQDE